MFNSKELNSMPQWQKLNSLPPWSNLNWLFQNPQILNTISSRHDVIHTQTAGQEMGLIMTMVIVISFVHKHKNPPYDYALELLAWIVQNPTKQNDKI